MEGWTSRKLVFASVWQLVFTVLVYFGKLPPATYESLTYVTIGGYLAANAITKFSGLPKEKQ